MSVSLPGYANNINPQTQVREGLEQLRQTSKDQAQEHLAQLRSDLQTKTGVVRLLHTSGGTDKDMKFKNAGAFKSMFLDGNKLHQSAEVIRDLLKNAGLSDAKVHEFDAYVQARGGQGVKSQKVLQFIDAMRTETGASPAEALSKFGVDLGAVGRLLGAGAYGTAHIVHYRGEEFVYKQPLEGGQQLGKLQLADASGQPIVPPVQENNVDDGEKSHQAYNSSHSLKEPSPLEKFKNQQVEDGYGNPVHDRSNSIVPKNSVGSTVSRNNSHVGLEFLMALGIERYNQGGADSVVDNRKSFELEPESPAIDNNKHHLRMEEESEGVSRPDPLANSAQAPMPVPAGVKLARSGMGNLARVKDLPQVITPAVLVVQEQKNNGALTYHAVAGQKTLKDWARTQASTSEFSVVGLLMPKAAGKTLCDDNFQMTVSRADLKPLAASALNLLKGLASHGFTHGDIKPENLIWDTKSKTLQLIDNDNLDKVSKKDGSLVNAKRKLPFTVEYINPVGFNRAYGVEENNEQLGLGRDLFAMGMTLLEASLHARGQSDKATKLTKGITFGNAETQQKSVYSMRVGKYIEGIQALKAEDFAPGSVEAFARSCIVKSIEHEQKRLGLNADNFAVFPRTATFDRYDPNRAGNDQHLLAQLERDLALLT